MNIRVGKKELEKIFTEFGPVSHSRDGAFFIIEADEDLIEYMDDFSINFDDDDESPVKYTHPNAKLATMHPKGKKSVQDDEPHPFRTFGGKKAKHRF